MSPTCSSIRSGTICSAQEDVLEGSPGFEGLARAQFVLRCAVAHAPVKELQWAQQIIPVSAPQPELLEFLERQLAPVRSHQQR